MRRAVTIQLALSALIVWAAACSEPNRAPFSCGPTPPQTVDMRDSISFIPCFTDPDADPLEISAEVAHHLGPYVDVSAGGETVTIHGKREHALLLVTLTATDPTGLYAMEEVEVTVRGLHDLAVLDAWPDSQTVQNGVFELGFEFGNVGETHALHSRWTARVSSDPVITTADSVVGAVFIWVDMAPGDTRSAALRFTNHPDPGKPYFGMCGVSQTPEYNLANNCSRGLKVIFPESAAEEARRQGPNGAFSVGSGEGAYAHGKNGEMVMELRGHPFEGEFGLRGDTLTTVLVSVVRVSKQALYHSPRGKLVWVVDAVP